MRHYKTLNRDGKDRNVGRTTMPALERAVLNEKNPYLQQYAESQYQDALDSFKEIEHSDGKKVTKVFTANNDGYIFFHKDGEIVFSLNNRFYRQVREIASSSIKYNVRDISLEAEYALFRIISESIPNDLVWEYLPTLLIFLQLAGLHCRSIDYSVFGDPWDINQYCLSSGKKLNGYGLFADGKKDKLDRKKRTDYYCQEFIKKRVEIKNKAKASKLSGVVVYLKIIDRFHSTASKNSSCDVISDLDYLVDALKLFIESSIRSRYNSPKYQVDTYNPDSTWIGDDSKLLKLFEKDLLNNDIIVLKNSASGNLEVTSEDDFYLDLEKLYPLLQQNFHSAKFCFLSFRIKKFIAKHLETHPEKVGILYENLLASFN